MKLIGTGASWASAPYQRIACMVLYCMELSATAGWLPDCLLFYVFFAIISHVKIHLLFVYTQVHGTVADVDWYWPAAWYFEKEEKFKLYDTSTQI